MPVNPQDKVTTLIGPFVGSITSSGVKIWLNVEVGDADRNVFVTLKLLEQGPKSEAEKKDPHQVVIHKIENPVVVQTSVIKCLRADLGTGIVALGNLEANARYSYQLWRDEAHSIPLGLRGLEPIGSVFLDPARGWLRTPVGFPVDELPPPQDEETPKDEEIQWLCCLATDP
ncbi:MAG: hypothetical protein ACXW3C_06920 [Pyrinomonadaceae bacterium]